MAPPGTEWLPLALAGTAAGSFLTLVLLDESAKVWGAQPGTEPGELCGNPRGLPSWQLPLRPLKAVADKDDQFKLHTPRPGFKKKKSSWSARLSDAKLKEQNHGNLAELLIPGREQKNKRGSTDVLKHSGGCTIRDLELQSGVEGVEERPSPPS